MKEPSILRIIAYISWALNAVLLVGIVMIAIALSEQNDKPMMQGAEIKNALYTYPELTYEAIIMNGPERIEI